MLKGHLEIELKDTNTGEVTKHEEDNMVTNAVANLLGVTSSCVSAVTNNSYNLLTYLLPVSQKALGGILMFDGPLVEDVNNIHFPMDVHLVGSAGRKANSSSKITGSFNETESHRNDNGYTSVWDFTTSQANGTIASLSLTHYLWGATPFEYMSQTNGVFQTNNGSETIAYDAQSGTMYLYYSGKIYSKKIYSHIIGVNTPDFSAEELVLDLNLTNPNYGAWAICNGYDGYIYCVNCSYRATKGPVTFKVKKIRISDFSFTDEGEQTFSVDNITVDSTSNFGNRLNTKLCVSRGYLYFAAYRNECLYKVNLSNTVDVKEIVFGDEVTVNRVYPMYSGGVYAEVWYYKISPQGVKTRYCSTCFVSTDDKFLYDDSGASTSTRDTMYYLGLEGDNLATFRSDYNGSVYYAFSRNYLGTICNLSTPVVKTSAQTMKITYTLTDAS